MEGALNGLLKSCGHINRESWAHLGLAQEREEMDKLPLQGSGAPRKGNLLHAAIRLV